jgi:putative DNA primase/helicase
MPHPTIRLTEGHSAFLVAHAVKLEIAERVGVYSADEAPEPWNGHHKEKFPGIIYPWRFGDRIEYQLATDDRDRFPDQKYVFRPGIEMILNELVPVGPDTIGVMIVEGTKQGLSAASYAPEGWAVYGVAGCWNWTNHDFTWLAGLPVVVIFDGDLKTNRDVHDAADRLQENLILDGAASVKWAMIPTKAKDGLDDFLAIRPDSERESTLVRLLERAGKLPRKPAGKLKKTLGSSGKFFDPQTGSLLALELAAAVEREAPLLLTPEHRIAAYRDGVYRLDGLGVLSIIARLLGNDYRPSYRAAAEDVIAGALHEDKLIAPTWMSEPVLNCRNTMLDLRTLEPVEHSPDFLSLVQLPVEWDPDARCPTYEAWLDQVVGDQGPLLEELASTMLDPTRTPTKALFAFGPSRSGKSTFLRLLKAIAGDENTTSVTLHQLADDRFAAANLYGKMLNVAADLSSKEVQDLGLFKLMTGVDMIHANRKYGHQFDFTNKALFGFSANELPQVSEGSDAYRQRVKPVKFGRSFAGNEDQSIEDRMLAEELPGILVRWVKAYRAHVERGYRYLDTDAAVQEEFDHGSDRVRQWVAEEMEIHPVERADQEVPVGQFSTSTELAGSFHQWATRNQGSGMGRNHLKARLTSINGVMEVRGPERKRGLNVTKRKPGAGSSGTSEASFPMHNLKKTTTVDDENRRQSETKSYIPHGEGYSESARNARDMWAEL